MAATIELEIIDLSGKKVIQNVYTLKGKLTPALARTALATAFGAGATGSVWHGQKGFRVYPNTAAPITRPLPKE